MDDEKSITEKFTDAIAKATDSVKTTMSNIVETASVAAQHAMESNAEKMSGQTTAELLPDQIAAIAAEPVVPVASDAVAMPPPLVAVQPAPKKRKPRAKSSAVETPPAKKAVSKKSAKKAAKKTAKKSAKKAKKTAKKTTKKTAKKAFKKTTKKASKKKKTKSKSKR